MSGQILYDSKSFVDSWHHDKLHIWSETSGDKQTAGEGIKKFKEALTRIHHHPAQLLQASPAHPY